MGTEANRHRESIKKTVEKAAPEIDTTKILSVEEVEELQRQFREREASKELAETLGREGLRERLKQSVKRHDAIRTKHFDPKKLNGQGPASSSAGA